MVSTLYRFLLSALLTVAVENATVLGDVNVLSTRCYTRRIYLT
jgi:hypothetical protein